MQTTHWFFNEDAREMASLTESDTDIDLVVTSPPYPMIEMWDDVFVSFNEEIKTALNEGKGQEAFKLMHAELDNVWETVDANCADGATICINIGDATRKIGGEFNLFPNHSRIIQKFREMGYANLPNILWRKPTNSAAKFMGSGMIPPNAYVTLEHEHILIFRKGGTRTVTDTERRYESAYFWEERNEWFSDFWSDIVGVSQELPGTDNRETAAAYPLEIPLRLIRMYSLQGDTVLDPFLGTGTTSLAAILAARNSVGVDIDEDLLSISTERVKQIRETSQNLTRRRIERHVDFEKQNGPLKYEAEHYDFTVTTKQEKKILPKIIKSQNWKNKTLKVQHTPFNWTG